MANIVVLHSSMAKKNFTVYYMIHPVCSVADSVSKMELI